MAYSRVDSPTPWEVMRVKGCQPGAVNLLNSLKVRTAAHRGRRPAGDGCYNKRNVRGSASILSTHAVGRGIDFGVDGRSPFGLELGNFLYYVLQQRDIAFPLSIQRIIWNYQSVLPGETPRAYKPGSSITIGHRDHLHIELNRHGAAHNTMEWVNGVLD